MTEKQRILKKLIDEDGAIKPIRDYGLYEDFAIQEVLIKYQYMLNNKKIKVSQVKEEIKRDLIRLKDFINDNGFIMAEQAGQI